MLTSGQSKVDSCSIVAKSMHIPKDPQLCHNVVWAHHEQPSLGILVDGKQSWSLSHNLIGSLASLAM